MEVTVHKAYKVRLYPNKEQERALLSTLGACRFVFNYFLAARKAYYKETGKTLSYLKMSKDLTHMREVMWLGKTQRAPLQHALRQLDRSYTSFFKRGHGYPQFKSKKALKQSFEKNKEWRLVGNKVQVDGSLVVKFRGSVDPNAKLGTLVVSYRGGKWYASIQATVTKKLPKRYTKPVGLDMGLKELVTTSKGLEYPNIQPQKTAQKRLTKAQRTLSRRQLGSVRWAKARLQVVKVYRDIGNVRRNYLHQVSSAITAKNHSLIAVEDLSVSNMLKNRRLARAIVDAGWGELLRQIEYKQKWKGGDLVKVPRFFPSSKLCSACGFLAETMPLSVRRWKCGGCGRTHQRDINAAKNILAEALASRVRGANVRPPWRLAVKRGR